MLIICDFDGTVTASDTNTVLAQRFAPDACTDVSERLRRRELTIREVLETQFRAMDAPFEDIVAAALEVPFRAGFTAFLEAAKQAGARVVLLSSGFRELIEPLLAHHGVADAVPLHANSVRFVDGLAQIRWRDQPTCALCGEACKRSDVAALRSAHEDPAAAVIFIGDGYSDRCGAESADRIFARDSLATWLADHSTEHETWNDFDDIASALRLPRVNPRT